MNYTPTQLEAIKLFGRKDLTAGCFAKWKGQENVIDIIAYRIGDTLGVVTYYKGNGMNVERIEEFNIDEYEILGHEPHLFPDVARVVEKNRTHQVHSDIAVLNDRIKIYDKWIPFNPFLPLLEQSESTLKQLISLFK